MLLNGGELDGARIQVHRDGDDLQAVEKARTEKVAIGGDAEREQDERQGGRQREAEPRGDLRPLGADDPKLWTATTYCMPIDRRIDLFRVPEPMA